MQLKFKWLHMKLSNVHIPITNVMCHTVSPSKQSFQSAYRDMVMTIVYFATQLQPTSIFLYSDDQTRGANKTRSMLKLLKNLIAWKQWLLGSRMAV